MSLNHPLESIDHENRNDAWIRRLDFFMLATWLVLGLWLAGIALLLYGMDFRGYYAAARVLLAGGNPYDYHQVAPVLLQITGEAGNNPYYYPPWFAWLFIPFVMLPFQIARVVWMALNLVIWNLGLWKLGKVTSLRFNGWRLYLLFCLATFSFAWITWRYEQAGILIFAILVAILITIEKGQWNWAGFWMALSLIKPNITLIVVTGLSLWLIRRRQWQPVIMMVIWLIILFAIFTWITPDWYKPFFEEGFGQGLTVVLDGPDKVVALRINTTFVDWLRTLGIGRQLQVPLYGVVVVVGVILLFLIAWYSGSLLQVMSVSLLVAYALTPYAMQYDNPSLIIVIFWALSNSSRSRIGILVGILLAGFVFSVIFWQQNISWAYWMVVGAAVLAGWAVISKKYYSKGRAGISNNS